MYGTNKTQQLQINKATLVLNSEEQCRNKENNRYYHKDSHCNVATSGNRYALLDKRPDSEHQSHFSHNILRMIFKLG